MLVYWILFLLPAVGVAFPLRLPRRQALVMFLLVAAVIAAFMGLRDQVGGDWFNYLPTFDYISTLDFAGALSFGDPAYSLLNWIAARLGGDIYAVNLVCAAIMMIGIGRFCRSLPNPWLALLVAVPYTLIVVGMGYTRQSVALGLVMLGLVALGQRRTRAFVIWVALAALFHRTAVLLIPIAAIVTTRRRVWTAFWVGVAFATVYVLLLQPDTDTLWANYVQAQMQSHGGLIRVLMNALPAALLLLFRKRLVEDPQSRRLWSLFAGLALACVPLVFMASTAVDRMALYLIPLQLFVFSQLYLLARTTNTRTLIVVGVGVYYAAVQFVWLNYAVDAPYWVPYHFMPWS
ncbi:EpsG family protein [Dokdonella soli]|uniref:EpsG family protein n=1 Tax=Dokdonella soli TaxID=529810 RepID=A0ABP3TJ93_9GAMM